MSKRLINETIDTRWIPLKVSKIFRQWAAQKKKENASLRKRKETKGKFYMCPVF